MILGTAGTARAQSLNWHGQNGGLVTPFATVVESPEARFGRPYVSFLMIDGGDIVGGRFQLAFTIGFAERFEIGYAKSAVAGEAEGLALLFDRGFQNIHGKIRLAGDATGSKMPAIAVGGRFAWQKESLTDAQPLRTGDIYLVATKTIAAGDDLLVLLNGGVTLTNALLLSLGGTASEWSARGFAAAALTVRDRVSIGGEVLQQPKEIELLPAADIPPTVTAFVRFNPVPNRLSIIVAWVRLAGVVAPGVDLGAASRFAVGGTFRF